MNRISKWLSIILAFTLAVPGTVLAASVAEEAVAVERLAGLGRMETAVEVSKVAYKEGAEAVVLAGYNGEVDALTGTLLANAKKAPVLLTEKKGLSKVTKDEITRLKAKTVYILGGETVVSKKVAADLEALENVTVKRVSGDNRFETAHEVASAAEGKTTHVFLALGANEFLADALSVGPVSAIKDMPVLLTTKNYIPQATKDAMETLGVTDVTIVGGETAISKDIHQELEKSYTVDRVSGLTREKTAEAIAKRYFMEPKNAILTNDGRASYADALMGGYLGALMNAPILLVQTNSMADTTKEYMEKNIDQAYILGGASVIAESVYKQVDTAVKVPTIPKEEESETEPSIPTPPPYEPPLIPTPEEIEITKLSVSTDSLSSGVETPVTFRYKYDGNSDHDFYLLKNKKGVFTPYQVNGENVELKDDGNQNNGDLLPNDAIYSAKVQIKEDEGDLELAVGVKSGSNWKIISTKENILVVNPLTEEEVEVLNKVSTKVQEIIKDTEMAPEKIKEKVLETLKENKEEIGQAEVSESGNSIWFTFKSGVLGAVTLESEAPASVLQTVSLFNMQPQSVAKSNDTSSNVSIGNPNAAIFTSAESKNAATLKSELADKSFIPKVFEGEDATVEEFKKMSEYGTLIFDTKGESLLKGDLTGDFKYLDEIFADESEKTIIFTGEKVNDTSLEKYNADLKTGRLAIVDDYYAITSAFVKHYTTGQGKLMQNALVYANTNQSMHNEVMAQTFTDSGAQTYIGYKKAVAADELVSSIKDMLAGKTVKETVKYAEVFGNKDLVLTAEQKIINGSLETDLTGWVGDGHIDTIARLGSGNHESWHTITPTQGDSMGIISSGVDNGALSGRQSWIYQTFTVPKDMTNLKFDYNIASSEPMVFIGTGYDDKFKATIVEGAVVKEPSGENEYVGPEDGQWAANYSLTAETEEERSSEDEIQTASLYNYEDWLEDTVDKNEKIIGFESINSSDWGQDYSDDRQRVDAIFPHGDDTTYMTGWKTVNYDVTEYQGKTITLKLQVWDLGDTAYPTAVLFDNVRLTKADYAGVGIEGRTEVRIPRYDTNEYFYQAGKVDQDGDILTGEIKTYEDNQGYVKPIRELTANVKLAEAVEGVELDEATGILTVKNTAKAGEITLIVFDDQDNQEKITVKLAEPEPSVAKTLVVRGNRYVVNRGMNEEYTIDYKAVVLDQYDEELLGKYDVKWSLAQEINGLSIDEENGALTINPELLEKSDIYTNIQVSLDKLDIYGIHQLFIINSEEAEGEKVALEAVETAEENKSFDDREEAYGLVAKLTEGMYNQYLFERLAAIQIK